MALFKVECPKCKRRLSRRAGRAFCENCGRTLPSPSHRHFRRMVVMFVLLIGGVYLSVTIRGCQTLKQQIVGKWEGVEGSCKGSVVEFTQGGKVLYARMENGVLPNPHAGFYRATGGKSVGVYHHFGDRATTLMVEFSSPDEVVVVSEYQFGLFGSMSGRWKRVSADGDRRP